MPPHIDCEGICEDKVVFGRLLCDNTFKSLGNVKDMKAPQA